MGSFATDLLTLGALGLLVYGVYKAGIFNNIPIITRGGTGADNNTSIPTGKGNTFHVVGDVDCTPATAENVAKGNPALTINVGDFSYKCASPTSWWNNELKAWSALGKQRNLAVIGNHDTGEADEYLSLFGNPGNKWQWIKKMGSIAFVGANTEDVDLDELEQILTKAQNDPTVKMIIIFQHKTCFLPKKKPLKPDASKSFHALYKRFKKVRMGFWGHNHFYARLRPVDGIQYITVGNGGHNPGKGPKARGTISNQLGVAKCVISGDTVSCKEVLNDGTVIDEWTVSPSKLPAGGEEIDGLNSTDTGDGGNEDDLASNYVHKIHVTPQQKPLVARNNKRLIYLPNRRY